MPHVVVKMYPGSSEEQKKMISEEITQVIMKHTNKPEGAVSVSIVEIEKSEWMEKVYDLEIRPNLDQLYKKPGY